MSVTIDANLLLYASDERSPRHDSAVALLARLATGPGLVYLFWPVAMAYLRISTHPSVFDRPLDPAEARQNLDQLVGRAHVRCPGEADGFWQMYQDLVGDDAIRGNLVTDSHIAALMRQHGVSTIFTADRDFRRFPGITTRDPYAEASGPANA
jgi:toxin-antitoxin system PIN domain toxin